MSSESNEKKVDKNLSFKPDNDISNFSYTKKKRKSLKAVKKSVVDSIDWDKVDIFKQVKGQVIVPINSVGEDFVFSKDILIQKERVSGSEGFLNRPKKWDNAIVPYVIEQGLENKDAIFEAIEYFNNVTDIRFIPRKDEADYVRFTISRENCYSHLGKIGGEQLVKLSKGCRLQEILHELMHTIGFHHEQSREDRDQFVLINWSNIEKENWVQFKRIPEKFHLETNNPFDYYSIMLYDSSSFAIDSNYPTIIKIDNELIPRKAPELSEYDIEKIRQVYR